MTWVVASIITVFKVIGGDQDEFPVEERFFLFNVHSKEELQSKINGLMKLIETAGDCNYCGMPAKQLCLGVRKVRSVYNDPPLDIDMDQPGDGTELTHSFMIVKSLAEAEKLAQGKTVNVRYVDDDDDDDDQISPHRLD